jgi:riboflavin synthase
MFTGIVQEMGVVAGVEHAGEGSTVRVAAPEVARGLRVGDSVSVDGACLTAVEVGEREVVFEAMAETLARTTLGSLAAGDPVNLEAALRAGEPLGGHIVQGHVDAVGSVTGVAPNAFGLTVEVTAPKDVWRYLVEKGSIAVSGVSLTVSKVTEDGFEVWLIPHTCEVTTLGRCEPGSRVNLEVDIFAKYVERLFPVSTAQQIPARAGAPT